MPVFYMTVGLPGSGKSSIAEDVAQKTGAAVHSSDSMRSEMFGDPSIQGDPDKVFSVLQGRVISDLQDGKSSVYDATNISYKRRKDLLGRIKYKVQNVQTVCLFSAAPIDTCLKNNRERERRVPEAAIRKMYRKFDVPMYCEGWDEILVNSTEQKSLRDLIRVMEATEHDNPHHRHTVGQHSSLAWKYYLENFSPIDEALERAVLFHDIGKIGTKVFRNDKGAPSDHAHFYNHERTGAYESFSYTYELPAEKQIEIALLIRWHMYPFTVKKSQAPEKTRAKLVDMIGQDAWKKILVLHKCDLEAH